MVDIYLGLVLIVFSDELRVGYESVAVLLGPLFCRIITKESSGMFLSYVSLKEAVAKGMVRTEARVVKMVEVVRYMTFSWWG